MTVLQAMVLGLLQGLTEFLPVSSSAHLALTPWVMGWPDHGLAFDVALHVGTLVAVLWYFRVDIADLTRCAIRVVRRRRIETLDERRVMFLIIGTIPAGVAGILLADAAEHAFRTPRLIASTLMGMGVLLWAVDHWAARGRSLDQMTPRDAVLIGVAQACALVPGVSRSGATMTMARALAFDRTGAARFSFLLSPIITAAAAMAKVPDAVSEGVTLPLLVGVVSAALSAWLAIAVLLRFLVRNSFAAFAVYRLVAGAAIFALAAIRGAA
jgi:undecaprenyl-diphosphatase